MKISKNIVLPLVGLLIFAAAAAGAYFFMPRKQIVKADIAVKKSVDFVNKYMLQEGTTATSKDVTEESGLYKFKLTVQGKDIQAYVTKDGKLFFAEGIPAAVPLDKDPNATEMPELAKVDKPDLKVFVMSYCPYGLMAEKVYLPVLDLFKGKVAMSINFVNYAMHGKNEVDENLRQYCIQKEQNDKYAAYLKCFSENQPAADGTGQFAKCLTDTQIDQTKLQSCISATDKQFSVTANFNDKSKWIMDGNNKPSNPKFEVENDLNTKYGVAGSPTFILNDTDISQYVSPRSPEKLKQVICSTFKNQPEECKQTLSNDQPSAGFGGGTSTTDASGAGCGS